MFLARAGPQEALQLTMPTARVWIPSEPTQTMRPLVLARAGDPTGMTPGPPEMKMMSLCLARVGAPHWMRQNCFFVNCCNRIESCSLAASYEHPTSIGSKAGWTGRACGVTSTSFGAAISPRTSSIAIIGGDFAGMRAGSEAVSVGSLCQLLG